MHRKNNLNKQSIVIWELTKACELYCDNCRVDALLSPHLDELSFEDGIFLIDQIAELNNPTLIFTGGDCFVRKDLNDLVQYATDKGITVSVETCPTPNITKNKMKALKDSGLKTWQFNIDGPTPEIHDYSRKTPGSFDLTIKYIHHLNELKIPHQINTVVTRYNFGMLEDLAMLVAELKAYEWHVSAFVPADKAQLENCITPAEHEQLFSWLYNLNETAPYKIVPVSSQHYNRVIMQKNNLNNDLFNNKTNIELSPLNISDGNNTIFISHTGDVFPNRLLPIKAGNVKEQTLLTIYNESDVFKILHNPNNLKGKCGKCEYRFVCGGSRSRAYAVTGDFLASEPFCIYVPEEIRKEMKKSIS